MKFIKLLIKKDNILEQLKIKLILNREEGKYVIGYFRKILKQNNVLNKDEIIRELSNGNINYYDLFVYDEQYKSYIDEFKENKNYFVFW